MNDSKKAAALVMACLVGVGGCNSREPVPPPNVTVNPSPVKRYKVRLTIPEPPGPLYVTAKVNYFISNTRECVPVDYGMALGGTHPSFSEGLAVPVVAHSETEYEVIFFEDAFRSEDYYGLGVCDWKGGPTFTIGSGGGSAVMGGGPEKVGEVATRLCPIQPTGRSAKCPDEEHAGPDLKRYFVVRTLTTKD